MILGKLYPGTRTRQAHLHLTDIVDHIEPVMLIVGSRGVSQLKGSVIYCRFPSPAMALAYLLNTASFWAQRHTI